MATADALRSDGPATCFITKQRKGEKHERKKTIERLSFMISPTSVTPEVPDTEPDLIIRISFYDIAKFLLGKASFSESFFLGRGELYGNALALIDIADILEVAQGKEINRAKEERPKIWPVGFP